MTDEPGTDNRPGVPLRGGFDFHPTGEKPGDTLDAEARARVEQKMADLDASRLNALKHMRTAVVG